MPLDRSQFWELLEPLHPKAEAFCRRLAGNRDDGDDLYQEAILTALTNVSSLRRVESFQPWFYRIIINRQKNRSRRDWWRRHLSLSDLKPADEPSFDPSAQMDSKRLLELALSPLKAKECALIVLFELEGRSLAELAGLYSEPEGTIKARLWRARQKMRRALIPQVLPNRKNEAREDGYGLPESKATAE